jgi:hypothetical protein
MDFIQNQIDRGYTSLMITNRGLKGDPSQTFKVYHYKNVDTVEKYNEILNSSLHANHEFGYSIGMSNPNL